MADTYAVNPGQGPGQAAMGGPVMDRTSPGASVGSGVSAAATQGNQQDARNLDAIMKLASEALQPHIKAAQTSQFLEGMQQAATGEGLTDIVDQQPWYTQIFGPSAAAMGARAYSQQAAISKFGADMERQMPALAKQGPEALMGAAQASMQASLTGDDLADAVIMGSYAEQLQPLMKRHAKEAYIYQQKQANAAQVTAWDAAFDAFQQRAIAAANPEGGMTAEDLKAEESRVLSMMGPFGDQSDESHQGNIVTVLQGAAGKGNFHIISLLKREGILKALPPDDQAKLNATFRAAGARALGDAMPAFAVDVAQLVNDTAQNPRDLPARAAALNAKMSAYTGVPVEYAQGIPNASLDNITGRIMVAQAAEAARPPPPPTREQEVAQARALVTVPGAVSTSITTGFIKDNVAEEAALGVWLKTAKPADRAAILNARGSGVYDAIKTNLQLDFRTNPEALTDGFRNVSATYQHLTEEAKGEYFTTAQQKVMDRYNHAVSAGMPPEQAWQTARVFTPLVDSVLPEKEVSGFQKEIRKQVESKNENLFGLNTVTDSALRVLETFAKKDYMENRGLQDVPTSVARSLAATLAAGRVEVLGKHAIINPPNGAPSILAAMQKGENNKGAKEVAEALDAVLQEKAKAAGMDLDKGNYLITRAADVGGQFRFLVDMGGDTGGNFVSITEADIRAYNKPAAPVLEGGAATGFYPHLKRRNPK